jgi:hypothetical protein
MAMTDYYEPISRAVRSLGERSAEKRHRLYEDARTSLLRSLQNSVPPLADDVGRRHQELLEQAIAKVEAEESQKDKGTPPRKDLAYHMGAFAFLLGPRREATQPPSINQEAHGNIANATRPSGCIFISYRRDDAAGFAGRIFDRLVLGFSREQIFMDVDNIEPGLDFVDVLNERVSVCDVLLALIGPNWAVAADHHGKRRLDDAHDFVRIEIEAALARKVRVVPVLISGSKMPRPEELPESIRSLTRRQAIEVSHAYFNRDIETLVRAIRRAIGTSSSGPQS